MLDLLRKLAQQQGVSSKLCSLGVIGILRSLHENGSPNVQRSADRTLTAVTQSDITPVLQPLSPNSDFAQHPRSTCQSNSPSVPQAQHQHIFFERAGEMHGRLSGCSTGSYKHTASSAVNSAASQAFGSQQGKDIHSVQHVLKAAVSSAQHSRVRLAAQKLICCTEVPSCTHEQRLSPDTASSHVAPVDESAARVRCRAQWRQQSQAPAQPSLTECGCTLRAISIGKPVAAEALLYAVLHQPKCHVRHHNMVKLASTVHHCHHTALGQPYPVAAPRSTCLSIVLWPWSLGHYRAGDQSLWRTCSLLCIPTTAQNHL